MWLAILEIVAIRQSPVVKKLISLLGSSGDDIINGNQGNDTITGGLGADNLTGGSGKDTFVFKTISESTSTSHDTIIDFSHGQDQIDFTNIPGITMFQGQLAGSGNHTLNPHSIGYSEVDGHTNVLVNTTNTAEIITNTNFSAANIDIVLVGVHLALSGTDFHL